ncbi:MAG TPA: efflux RND transporter periplasmic adaptor subunit [Clostridia bacterium]|nr:efflux RND transporter periplasmic adaptor subunit [Clostridia bacterium]
MAARRKNNWLKWTIVLLAVGAVAFGLYYRSNHSAKDTFVYRTAPVSRGDITQSVTANGQISAVKNVQVGSQISGTLKEINVDFNSRVKEGEVIAQIDPSTYERNVEEAAAQVASAQAALDLTQVNLKRARELATNNLVPIAELDQAAANFNQAEATLKIREAALKRAQVDLERTTIYAPISGVVISRNVEVGQTVAASFNTPTLFVIANDLARMQIEAAVSEADVGGVAEQQPVEFTVDAYPTRQFQGTVKQVRFAPSTNQNVVTYTTIIDVNNDDLKLRPGMTANASIITAQKTNVLRVANAALRFRPPEGAVITGATNTAARSGTNPLLAAAGNNPGSGGERSSGEEMRRRFETMSPEEREQFRQRMQARGGEGAPGGAGGGRRRDGMVISRTVYTVTGTNAPGATPPVANAVSIKTGIADTSYTEVLSGLEEGNWVITGSTAPRETMAGRPPGSPFGGFGMRPR